MSKNEARKLIHKIISQHPENLIFTGHAVRELANDNLSTVDAKITEEGEFENESYRYRLHTTFIMVVVAFDPLGKTIIVVTAWDKRKRNKKG